MKIVSINAKLKRFRQAYGEQCQLCAQHDVDPALFVGITSERRTDAGNERCEWVVHRACLALLHAVSEHVAIGERSHEDLVEDARALVPLPNTVRRGKAR